MNKFDLWSFMKYSVCMMHILFRVKYVDFRIREDKGYIRFEQPEAAQKAHAASVSAKEGGLVVKNFIANVEPVTGKEDF